MPDALARVLDQNRIMRGLAVVIACCFLLITIGAVGVAILATQRGSDTAARATARINDLTTETRKNRDTITQMQGSISALDAQVAVLVAQLKEHNIEPLVAPAATTTTTTTPPPRASDTNTASRTTTTTSTTVRNAPSTTTTTSTTAPPSTTTTTTCTPHGAVRICLG